MLGGRMGKLLDLNARLRKTHTVNEKIAEKILPAVMISKSEKQKKVLDMTEAREAIINKERRIVKRTILSEFIGAFVVLPEKGLYRVTIYDISDGGIAFDVDANSGQYQQGEEVAMRVYLNHKTYFSFIIKITNARLFAEENIIRHGANFTKGTINDVALHHFVKFIETISASLKTDDGDIQVSHIS